VVLKIKENGFASMLAQAERFPLQIGEFKIRRFDAFDLGQALLRSLFSLVGRLQAAYQRENHQGKSDDNGKNP
jgi:hypothetical protein